jgi:hypothetical protein
LVSRTARFGGDLAAWVPLRLAAVSAYREGITTTPNLISEAVPGPGGT